MSNNNDVKTTDNRKIAAIVVLALVVIAVIVIVICKIVGGMGSGNSDVVAGAPVDYEKAGFITIGNYDNIAVSVEVSDEEVEEEIQYILEEGYELYDKLEGVAKSGDMVNINYEAFLDGNPVEDEAMEDAFLNIGEEEYFPEFDTGIAGMKTGETKEIDVAISEDYGYDLIDGKTVQYKVTLNYICGDQLEAELNDEFVTEYSDGECTSVDDFKEYVKNDLYESNVSTLADDVWSQLIEDTTVEKYHKGELEKATEETRKSYETFAEFAGYDSTESFLSEYDMTDEDVEEVAKEMALDKMVAKTIAVKENLSLDDETYRELLISYMEYEDESADIATLESEYVDSYCEEPKDGMLLELVKKFVAQKADVTGLK